ncbi:MAG TPA: mandelate racemase/muconate lactonizing enzyme family protein, partial [Planctomycetaceae bacterium]|nr:mandelate racemase/muconate lactonizing enzyme family protein [Planctomycetaceae bacterium]
ILYPQLIDTQVEVEAGRIVIPKTPGLGTAWLPELFTPGTNQYRATEFS